MPPTRAHATAECAQRCPVKQLFHANRDMTQNNCAALSECERPIFEPTRMRGAEKEDNNVNGVVCTVPHVPDVGPITRFSKRSIDETQTTGKKNRSIETSHKQRRCVKTLQMTMTTIHERDHQTNVWQHIPRNGSAAQAGNACPQGSHYKRWRFAGPKSHPKMRCHFSWSPSLAHADLMFMDLPMTQASSAKF